MSKPFYKSDIVIAGREYTDGQGQKKVFWNKIGELTTFENQDGTKSTICELFHIPGVQIRVFPQRQKQQTPAQQPTQQYPPVAQQPAPQPAQQITQPEPAPHNYDQDIQVQDIPF